MPGEGVGEGAGVSRACLCPFTTSRLLTSLVPLPLPIVPTPTAMRWTAGHSHRQVPFCNAIRLAKKAYQSKIIASDRDLVGLCLYATKEKRNQCGPLSGVHCCEKGLKIWERKWKERDVAAGRQCSAIDSRQLPALPPRRWGLQGERGCAGRSLLFFPLRIQITPPPLRTSLRLYGKAFPPSPPPSALCAPSG